MPAILFYIACYAHVDLHARKFGLFGLPRSELGLVLKAATIETVGFAAFTTALDLGPVAVVAVVSAQFSSVAVVLGAVVLHERLHQHQWLGVAMMICSTTLLVALQ